MLKTDALLMCLCVTMKALAVKPSLLLTFEWIKRAKCLCVYCAHITVLIQYNSKHMVRDAKQPTLQ